MCSQSTTNQSTNNRSSTRRQLHLEVAICALVCTCSSALSAGGGGQRQLHRAREAPQGGREGEGEVAQQVTAAPVQRTAVEGG